VWREIARQLPHEDTIYFADQIHIPYGPRSMQEIRLFSEAITRFLLARSCKLIVVACNTASAAALKYLRATFPDVPFVGMEPAVKPAAETTRTGIVGVLATPATFQGELFASVVGATACSYEKCARPGAAGGSRTPDTLTHWKCSSIFAAHPRSWADTIVLGCTHYPFVIDAIRQLAPGVNVIDPAPAVARQVERVLRERGWLRDEDRTGNSALSPAAILIDIRTFAALVNVERRGRRAWSTDQRSL
jgi:glutamate racemase